jgi:hypothetical protein
MSTHSLCHAVKIQGDPAEIQHALTTAQGLQGWNDAKVSGGGGVGARWTFAYDDGPTFEWEVVRQDADSVSWKCVQGPGDSVGTTADFHLSKEPDGRVHVKFEHAGWPHTAGNFAKCNSLWGKMLHDLREHVEG